MFLAGHPSQGCFGLQSHCAPCYFFNQASFYPSDFSFNLLATIEDKDVKDIIRLIKQSQTYDLVDVEEALMPSIYELYQYGVTFDSLVAACSFEGVYCYRENFTVLYHPNYGKCYMFNYVGNEFPEVEKPIEIDRYGSTSGLQLLLRVSDLNDLDLLRREIGARVVIHDSNMLPFVDEYGVNVRPKDMTAVELSLSETQRLGEPWGNCEEEGKTMYNGDPYSILGCEKYCGYKHMTERCNCTMRHFLRGSVLNRLTAPYPFCNITDDNMKCVSQVTENIEGKTECNCKPPCRETVYSYTVTSSELNENYYKTVKAIRTLTLDAEGKKKYMNYSDAKLMVGVKVYYNTFQVSKYNEVASYSVRPTFVQGPRASRSLKLSLFFVLLERLSSANLSKSFYASAKDSYSSTIEEYSKFFVNIQRSRKSQIFSMSLWFAEQTGQSSKSAS
ncbi:amiloride-sensitive sodium channel subunit delta [Trichonephila clavipes]|nr:amiloride-sensitive sodium channel subunit delta [Trichonephila clavipes]